MITTTIASILPVFLLDTGAPDFVIFLGRFHPLLVHLPIGFILLAIVFEFLGRREKYKQLTGAIPFTWFVAALSAVGAAGLGFLLSYSGEYSEGNDTLFWHQWSGIMLAIVTTVIWLIKSGRVKMDSRKVQLALVVVSGILLAWAGHLGGSLTHGSDYLTQYLPGRTPDAPDRPPVTDLNAADAFADVVNPILQKRCKSCHNPDKKKGELLVTSFAALMDGGEGGAVIKTGNAGDSELYRRVTLPEDHDEFMPEGKRPLTDEQISILEWWIDAGAPETGLLGSMVVSADMQEVIGKELGIVPGSAMEAMASKVSAVSDATIGKLRASGFNVSPLAQDNPFVEVDFSVSDTTIGAGQLSALMEAKEQIIWLNLGRSEVKDDVLETVGQFPNLVRLRLHQTQITDEGLQHLRGLSNLESLNLFGTNVTDEGLKHLTGLSNLKRLYLWGTKVSESGVQELQKALPELDINTGVSGPTTSNS